MDHYVPRKMQYTPISTTIPRFFPVVAFTGRRRTVIFDADGNVERDFIDQWTVSPSQRYDEEKCGETWFEVAEPWIQHKYPKVTVQEFRPDIQDILFHSGATQGVYSLRNVDKVFIGRQTMSMRGMLPSEAEVPVSSFIHTHENGWMMLEDRVKHRDRVHLRLKHANLVKAVPIYLQIHYESELEDWVAGQQPMVGELYTETEPVSNCAIRRGHRIMPSVTLKTGYDLLRPQHRKLAVAYLHENRPFCLMIAFPCSVWSALSHLTAGRDPNRRAQLIARRKREKILVEFAAERAMDQILHGCHFIMENPATSCAWRIVGKLRRLVEKSAELKLYYVRFDQCQFGLLGPGGGPHQKRTAILTSSREVAMLLRGNLCRRQHEHEPVIGGRRVTEKAGHYPQRLAETLVEGVEREFNKLYDTIWYDEMLVTERRRDEDEDNDDQEGEESDGYEQSDPPDPGDQPPQDGNAGDGGLHRDPEGRDPEDELVDDVEVPDGEPSVQDKRMALHLHSVTGHRPPLRLARALVMTGADPMLVKAAKTVKCEVCAENGSQDQTSSFIAKGTKLW